jgi:hypothetical protein
MKDRARHGWRFRRKLTTSRSGMEGGRMREETLMSSGGQCFSHNFIVSNVSFTNPDILIRQERFCDERTEPPAFHSFQKYTRVRDGVSFSLHFQFSRFLILSLVIFLFFVSFYLVFLSVPFLFTRRPICLRCCVSYYIWYWLIADTNQIMLHRIIKLLIK